MIPSERSPGVEPTTLETAWVDGRVSVRAPAGPSEIVVTATERLAGAVHSLTWNGKEFIDSHDHGRQLQSACSFDCGRDGPFWAECFNPTEAGSRRDGAGPRSSSKLLALRAVGNELSTVVQPAFWLAPSEASSGRPALNEAILSEHRIAKRLRIGYDGLPHVVEYQATFTVPPGEGHRYAQFEAVTGYMPAEFAVFRTFDPQTGRLAPLDDGPGEQKLPVVFSTADDRYAMGVYSPEQPSPGFERAGYGRFRFPAAKVTKWNCVFRERNRDGIPPGEYAYQSYIAVGTTDDVRQSLRALVAKFANR